MFDSIMQIFGGMGGLSPAEFWPALGQIMLINLILSGDNAVVIALACRGLPPSQRKWGIILGALRRHRHAHRLHRRRHAAAVATRG